MKKNVIIIGCSIAGSAAAYLCAHAGLSVKIYDQKKPEKAGTKVCDSIVTTEFLNVCKEFGIAPEQFFVKQFSAAKVFTDTAQVELPVHDFKISREKLVAYFMKGAEKAGAEVHFQTRLLDLTYSKQQKHWTVSLESGEKKFAVQADIIIGADGALSPVAKAAGLWQNRQFMLGLHAHAELPGKKPAESYEIFLGKKYGYYSYIVPLEKGYLFGRIARQSPDNMKEFTAFLAEHKAANIKYEAAVIPIHNPFYKTGKKNLFLIGDAGCQTKASFGGIIQGLKAAYAVKEKIITGKSSMSHELQRELFIQNIIRHILEKTSDKEFGRLLNLLNSEKVRKSMQSRDRFAGWFFKLALAQPKLIPLGIQMLF